MEKKSMLKCWLNWKDGNLKGGMNEYPFINVGICTEMLYN